VHRAPFVESTARATRAHTPHNHTQWPKGQLPNWVTPGGRVVVGCVCVCGWCTRPYLGIVERTALSHPGRRRAILPLLLVCESDKGRACRLPEPSAPDVRLRREPKRPSFFNFSISWVLASSVCRAVGGRPCCVAWSTMASSCGEGSFHHSSKRGKQAR
jgi:hypothetical protein